MSYRNNLVEGLNIPKHVAIIMDGNGRWAQKQSQDRLYGHSYGVESVREVVKSAVKIGIEYLTIYAFSTENWGRPQSEVDGLMEIIAATIASETAPLAKQGVKLEFIGNSNELPKSLQEQIDYAKTYPIENVKLHLVLALNYSSRWEITDAVKRIGELVEDQQIKPVDITEEVISQHLQSSFIPDPDLLIRTSGEVRLSNFLLWQLSYSELVFTDVLWPDFNGEEFIKTIQIYSNRNRRFGKI